jgi:hypothetical protein
MAALRPPPPIRFLFLDQIRIAREQRCTFEHPAEIFFARVVVRADVALQTLEHFVADLQPFEADDAHKVFTALPRLTLFQFHAVV